MATWEGTPSRGEYAALNDNDLVVFLEILGPEGVCTDPESLAEANQDWMKKYVGKSSVLLLPRTTAQVPLIMRHCNDRTLAVVPQGGNTGLVGGSIPVHDEIILGMKRMNRVISIDRSAGAVVCEAGCVLETLEIAVNEEGFTVPLEISERKESARSGETSARMLGACGYSSTVHSMEMSWGLRW